MNFLTIFIRGFLMGACDIVPGISGGTIAFITGIYDRLLSSLGSLSTLDIKLLKKGRFNKFIKPLDLKFLVPLGLGILLAVILISKIILSLLNNYPSLTFSFFVGLIIASGVSLFLSIKKKTPQTFLYIFSGVLFGIFFSVLPIQQVFLEPNLLYVLAGGFFAITAMLLPGISGSFLLLVLGLYVSTLEALHNFDIWYLVFFSIGAMLSLLFVTRSIKKLLLEKHSQTLAVLTGILVGALLVPIKQITFETSSLIFIFSGIVVSFLLSKFSKI